METSTVNSSFYVCLLLIAGFSALVGSWDSCPETSCGNLRIRFPFRITGRQPEQCGYPGFDLECSSANDSAVIELPSSVKLNVKNIDYKSQTIQLYDPSGCLARHVRNITPLPSPFQFNNAQFLDDFIIFNCSSAPGYRESYYSTCLSSSTYQVYAYEPSDDLGLLPLSFCSKIFDISSVPYEIFRYETLHLMWSDPNCKYCESKGTRCGFKNRNTSYETACLGDHKGIIYMYIYGSLASKPPLFYQY